MLQCFVSASILFLPMSFGALLATVITEKIGRRLALIIFSSPVTLQWLMIYFARDMYVFIAARLIAGFCFGGALPLISMITAECSSPKMRGFNLTLMAAVLPAFGTFSGSNLGLALSWRTAALVAIAPSLIATLAPIFCVESPTWLASRGRFEECEKAFISLHGHTRSAQKELKLILEVEQSKLKKHGKNNNTLVVMWQQLKLAVTKSYFWDVMSLSITLNIYKMISGKILFNIFGAPILQKITGQSDVLSYSLVVQGVCVTGSPVICFLMTRFKVRSLLFPFGVASNIIVIALSISLYVQPTYDAGSALMYANVSLYGLFLLVAQVLLFPILEALPQELYPLEIKGACTTLIAFIATGFMFVYLKVVPDMFELLDYPGTFVLNAIVTFLFLVHLWFKLPETKDRMLHEIELYFKNKTFVCVDDVITGEQMKVLV